MNTETTTTTNAAEELLTKVDAGEILPADVPAFDWDCDTNCTQDGERDECTTTLTLTVGNDEAVGSWESSDHRRGWDRLTTLAALAEIDAYAENSVVYDGWVATITRHEDGAQISIDVDDLADQVTGRISSNDRADWDAAVDGWVDHLLDETVTD